MERRFGENPDPLGERLELAKAEHVYWERKKQSYEALRTAVSSAKASRDSRVESKDDKYRRFYCRGVGLSSDFEKDAGLKRRLLVENFPERFGKVQPLDRYTNSQIGALFNQVLQYSKLRRR